MIAPKDDSVDRARLELTTPAACPPALGYSQAAIVSAGRLALISGQVGVDAKWRLAPSYRAQTEQAFRNLRAAVEGCGAAMADIAKLTIYSVGSEGLATYCEVRDAYFPGQPNLPASTFICVAGLYRPEALIEIEAVVALPR